MTREIIDPAAQGYAAWVLGRKGFGCLPGFMLGSVASNVANIIADIPIVIVG